MQQTQEAETSRTSQANKTDWDSNPEASQFKQGEPRKQHPHSPEPETSGSLGTTSSSSSFSATSHTPSISDSTTTKIQELFHRTRRYSQLLCSQLSAEDMQVQSMADASPSKWHLAHTTWFFETFILCEYLTDYPIFNPDFAYLFNSYYESEGERHPRPHRGLLTRPRIEEVWAYRQHVDHHLEHLINEVSGQHELWQKRKKIEDLIEIGCHHEMQHQELILTDILHAFSHNRLAPQLQHPQARAFEDAGFLNTSFSLTNATSSTHKINKQSAQQRFCEFEGGLVEIGHSTNQGFAYDCEGPKHRYFLQPFALAQHCVTNGQWLEFMEDGGYQDPLLWLSDGWHYKNKAGWQAPLYWQKPKNHSNTQQDEPWFQYSSTGLNPMQLEAPVCHISYYEADAYARWAGLRLPTEQEWEFACKQQHPEQDFAQALEQGNFSEKLQWQAVPEHCLNLSIEGEASDQSSQHKEPQLSAMLGNVWEWTQSPYMAYPGFRAEQGALGEYNGKFMVNQFVLRGGSCATPQLQMRSSYRNFFYPQHRWQFSGLRLARDLV